VKVALKQSAAVFSGEVLEIGNGRNYLEVRLRVERSWKGVEGEEVSLLTDSTTESPHYRIGQKYLVFADKRDGKLFTGNCSRTKKLEYAQEDLKQLDKTKDPSPQLNDPAGQEVDCQDPMSCIRLAQLLADKGEQLDAALAYVQRAYSIPAVPNDAVPRESFFLVEAYVRIRRGEFEQAIATLTRGVQRAPYYARGERYLSYLGLAYEKTGRIDEAIETYISLAGGIKTISDKPGKNLLALYRKRYGKLAGLEDRIEANRLMARQKLFVDSQRLNIPAPDWVLQDLDGRDVKLSDFANRVVVLRFVTTQFGDDVEKLKFLQEQYEKYQKMGVAFICIDEGYPHPIEQRRHNIREALARVQVTIPIVIDPDGEVARRYATLESLIVLIDTTGTIRFKNSLWHDYHPFITEQIEYLLKPQEE
jgi:tetratricopeptide (TPR) repeat protein